MESVEEHPCSKTKSRWVLESGVTCPNPTSLSTSTIAALQGAISSSSDKNSFVRDVSRTLTCSSSDITVATLSMQIQVGL
jgi:hypothetical protein